MTSIPLLNDQDDVELGELPSYEQVMIGKTKPEVNNDPPSKRWSGSIFDDFERSATIAGAVAYASITIRLGFLRKVLGILSFQLVLTSVFSAVIYSTPELRLFLQQQSWIVLISIFGSLILLFAMFRYAHTVPQNYILLVLWTVMQSIAVGTIVSFFDVTVVIEAAALTALIVVGLFLYTLQSKRDFQSHWAALFSVSMIFLVASFVQIFIQSALFNFVMAMFGAALFSVYLVFDVDRIMHHSSPEDYIEACVSLYLDIINLFLRILQIINELNRN